MIHLVGQHINLLKEWNYWICNKQAGAMCHASCGDFLLLSQIDWNVF